MATMVSRTLSVHQEHELLLKLEAAGLDGRLAQRVVGSKGNVLASGIVQRIADDEWQSVPGCTSRLIKTLTVTLVGKATDAKELIAQGAYDGCVDPLITVLRFPVIQPHDPVTVQLELFQFDHNMWWDDVIKERTRHNLDEPTFEHGLYLGIQHPDEQRQHPIVITHQPVPNPLMRPSGGSVVLVLEGSADCRMLALGSINHGWITDNFFIVGVRKVA